jgi:hypothetical protein
MEVLWAAKLLCKFHPAVKMPRFGVGESMLMIAQVYHYNE